jgi:hypothetical protein
MIPPPSQIPVVDTKPIEEIVASAWQTAAQPVNGSRVVVIITPDRILRPLPSPPIGSMPAQAIAPIEELAPSTSSLRILAISNTDVLALMMGPTRAIPFLGILLGLSYIGHKVVVFEGNAKALPAAVPETDIVIVDSAMLPLLPEDWMDVVKGARGTVENIFIHDRSTFQLAALDEFLEYEKAEAAKQANEK